MELKQITLNESATLKDAMELLERTGMGLAFVTDKSSRLVGILSDGDIRRTLLKDPSLHQSIHIAMNRDFVSLPVTSDNQVILESLNSKIKIIPLVDKDNKLVDYASINKIRTIPVAAPLLNGNELAYITECIRTNWISSQGKYVRQFETFFADYHAGRKSLAVSNGTVALHLALEALNIGKGDEVIVPDLTFAASINAILYTGATPVIADVDPQTWNIATEKIEKLITKNTKAIMPVHLYGYPCDMNAIMVIARKHNLFVVEDCAEALGSYYQEKPVGIFGDAATFSFYGNKIITTGEGGMIVFKDNAVADRAAILRDHGMQKNKRYWHQEVGYNYRLTNLQAAIGVAQFERLDEFIDAKRKIAHGYNHTLSKSKFFQTPPEEPGYINVYWLYTFIIKATAPFTREELMEFLTQRGVETRPVFFPLHVMPPYEQFGKAESLTVSSELSARGMSLPSSVNLTEIELAHICKAISDFVEKY